MNESVKLTKDMLIVLAVSSVPSLRLATKSLLHVSPSLCQLCQEILTSSHTPCHRERISSHVVCCTGITAAVDVLLSPFWVPNDSFCPEAKSEMIGDYRRCLMWSCRRLLKVRKICGISFFYMCLQILPIALLSSIHRHVDIMSDTLHRHIKISYIEINHIFCRHSVDKLDLLIQSRPEIDRRETLPWRRKRRHV